MKKISLLMFFIVLFLCSSCMQEAYRAPYVLSGLESMLSDSGTFFNYAGVFAEINNSSSKDIAFLEISFDVFDRTTKKNSFSGSNHITSSFSEIIYSGDTAELCISLDSFMHAAPTEKYLISNFCINTISYTDGTRWTDYLCIYSVNSN